MDAQVFDADASPDQRRVIIRRSGGDVEMVRLPWGLQPREAGGRSFPVIRSEERTFPDNRCLVPASEFRHRRRGELFCFALAGEDWFYLAGIWRPATRNWPESFTILTVEANADIAPYQDRQMAVLRREQRMAWLDMICPEAELLRPLPAGSFTVTRLHEQAAQAAFAF